MNDYFRKLLLDRIILRVLCTLFAFGILGPGFIVLSQYAEQWHWPIRSASFREIGVALLVTAALTLLWDLIGKRAFTDEVLAKANMSRDLADAGIRLVTPSFMDTRISWHDLFKSTSRLDIWVAYANTWRNSHGQDIEKMLSRKNAQLRVVMPDPENQQVMDVLAARFQTDAPTVKKNITEAIEGFRKFSKHGKVEIFVAPLLPLFTMYFFGSTALLAFYNHRQGRIPVPTFLSDEEGFIFKYLTEEFEAIIASAKKLDVSANA